MVSDNQCPWKPAIQVSKYCRPFPTLELGGVKDIGSPPSNSAAKHLFFSGGLIGNCDIIVS